jgi:hypothetical protein
MAARKWNLEQKLEQSRRIYFWRPWEKSTGPRSLIGKNKSSKNSLKHGNAQLIRVSRKLLRLFKIC